MTKFKVGDKVRDIMLSKEGVIEDIDEQGRIRVRGSQIYKPERHYVSANAVLPVTNALSSLSHVARNAVRNAAASVVRNGIGDCFSDAAAWCKDAASTGKVQYLKDALRDVEYVTSYSWANAKDKAGKAKCVALIKAAISKPTPENIKKAEAACTVERKRADGESIASVRNSAVMACNADGDGLRVKVITDTETLFGKKHEEKIMTIAELKTAMTKIGHGRLVADVIRDIAKNGFSNPYLPLPSNAAIGVA